VSHFLPYEFTSVVEDAGYSLKSDLPAPVAETLPNTGGGWTFLALGGGALLLTGRFLIRRFSS
jgi:LPXTG-motif cell wall-anchored protein